MAEHGTVEFNAPSGDDYPDHLKSYEGFLTATKYGTITVIVIMLFLAIFVV
jgi:hypothetical protein